MRVGLQLLAIGMAVVLAAGVTYWVQGPPDRSVPSGWWGPSAGGGASMVVTVQRSRTANVRGLRAVGNTCHGALVA